MTNAYSSNPFVLLLPKLKSDSDVRSGKNSGEWTTHHSNAFQNVAASLDYQAPGELKNVSSVPTMWARPLTMEMALHNSGHPIREQMVDQWQGMLAAIAFAAMHGHDLKVKLLQLEKYLSYHPFAKSLNQLLPNAGNSLYNSKEKTDSDQHPWKETYLFFWNKKPVGMTTPSTLVVPSEEGDWTGLRWWRNGTLRAPHPYLSEDEKARLWKWLEHLQMQVGSSNSGSSTAVNTIVRLLEDYKASLLAAPPEQAFAFALTEDTEFFGAPLNRGVLKGLNLPIKAPERPSSVSVVASKGKSPSRALLLIDPTIADKWGERPENIHIYKDKTLASLNLLDLRANRLGWDEAQVKCVEPSDLFLPELTFIDHTPAAFPGGLMPEETQPLTLAGERITPLIPINPILLDYLTPEYLSSHIKFRPLNGAEPQVEVILDLPLAGTREGNVSTNYRLSHIYTLKKECALDGVPVLEVWPNLRSPNWREYYAFYFDSGLGKDTFQVEFPESKDSTQFKSTYGGIYQTVRLEQFPSVIQCRNVANQIVGLILPKQPDEIFPNAGWRVGVDFGTSFTNVYIGRGTLVEPLPLETLHLKVTESPSDTRFPTLLDYFIPESFLPPEKPMPLSSVLTTLGSSPSRQPRAIFDGRIYVPSPPRFDPRSASIETDLKWSNFSSNRLFLKHLILHISAVAIRRNVNQISWSLSYPSAFSRNDRNAYARAWKALTDELSNYTGITYICSDNPESEHFRTESLAIAQYFADEEQHDLVYSTCIDMGGGTSDISIWEDNRLIHQCSVQLAGRDLLSKFLELNPSLMKQWFGVNLEDWRGLKDVGFNAKFDVLLRWESEKWLNQNRPTLSQDETFQGLIGLTAIGVAGLFYYVGTLLKALYDDGKYGRGEITPVYFGGNGSRLLHWLDDGGKFDRQSEVNELLSRMLSRGSGFEDTEVITRLSDKPKDEVACGLVLTKSRLKGFDRKFKDPIIAGENCELNGVSIAWNERLEIEEDVQTFRIPTFDRLSRFLYDFHVALKDLDIEGIRPLKTYKRSLEPSDNQKIWSGTKRALDKLLQDNHFHGDSTRIRVEPPFILCLKALLNYLSSDWAGR
jgi:hypothetical protein